jgi:hypothetical protein
MRFRTLLTPLAAALALLCLTVSAASAQSGTARMVSAANAFLARLSAPQRQKAMFAFDDAEQRARWSNLPVANVPRAGLSLGELSAPQRQAAMALVAAALSTRGLQKVNDIMEADETLRVGNGVSRFGKDLYFISFLGTPSATQPWMLQFGGHHLALNITVAGTRGVLTPSLVAAQPGQFTLGGRTIRPMGGESDKAAELFNSLSEEQRKQAVLSFRLADLVLGPGNDGRTITPEGIKAGALNEKQRALLLETIGEWANIIHDSAAAERMAEIRANLGETWFAWSGPANAKVGRNIESYYRIQGPTLVIEYAPQRGDPAMHIHSMYRDPTNDYGRKLTGGGSTGPP